MWHQLLCEFFVFVGKFVTLLPVGFWFSCDEAQHGRPGLGFQKPSWSLDQIEIKHAFKGMSPLLGGAPHCCENLYFCLAEA